MLFMRASTAHFSRARTRQEWSYPLPRFLLWLLVELFIGVWRLLRTLLIDGPLSIGSYIGMVIEARAPATTLPAPFPAGRAATTSARVDSIHIRFFIYFRSGGFDGSDSIRWI